MPNQNNPMLRVFFVAFILVCLAVVAVSTIDIVNIARAAGWPTTEGNVLDSRIIAKSFIHPRFGSPQPVYTYEETVGYSIKNTSYSVTIQTLHRHNGPIQVSYDPKNPTDILLGPRRPSGFEIILLAAALAALVFIAHRWWKQKKTA
jgi:hypothetical protein